jgi:6-phosphogluconate dehydrogenase
MKVGFVGLGRMGGKIVRRLLRKGHKIAAFAPRETSQKEVLKYSDLRVSSLPELKTKLSPPRVVWVTVPPGAITKEMLRTLMAHLKGGDILIEGGNSFYTVRGSGDWKRDTA